MKEYVPWVFTFLKNSKNKKIQNGSKNPFPMAKDFTPNGGEWVGYEPTTLAPFDAKLIFND